MADNVRKHTGNRFGNDNRQKGFLSVFCEEKQSECLQNPLTAWRWMPRGVSTNNPPHTQPYTIFNTPSALLILNPTSSLTVTPLKGTVSRDGRGYN